MKVYVDLHIHSVLSPCADEDMTPNNIVNMAILKGLQMIAITDHNAIGNVSACIKASQNTPLLVVPGIEITTQEEVHLLAYFNEYTALASFYKDIERHLPPLQNRPDIFGHQWLFDSMDRLIDEDNRLLMNAIQLSFDQLIKKIIDYGGVPVPAHVNRDSFSILSNLGFIPSELPIHSIEVVKNNGGALPVSLQKQLAIYRQIISSDAHNLGNLLEQVFFVELKQVSIKQLLQCLSRHQEAK
ncbi:PHP domain-containing protein [Anoxynatronum buryatiense]|uniref:Polymerase/histidinol phosphatase N-terminal domain-containing protein n=1 Tax=Anoxynatronum buryatiense TaxID=489973 RepID=A0AA46AIK3_9CLOT|nr:PHP domain-containing protein [Anoxynatronum buryatiense]SMP49822.1 hypothetical protein SAMN06296020_103386 [Anoxynatronum buryatiense]